MSRRLARFRGGADRLDVSFLRKWLGFDRKREPFIVRPARTLQLALPFDSAFARVLEALDSAVGAQVRDANRERGTIDATFGLTFSERIACSLRRIDADHTEVTIESRQPATSHPTGDFTVLNALVNYLQK